MKILLITAIVCMMNILFVSSRPLVLNKAYTIVRDTFPPNTGNNPSNMQPTPPSTVNGNGTPVMPPDTSRSRQVVLDTTHTIH